MMGWKGKDTKSELRKETNLVSLHVEFHDDKFSLCLLVYLQFTFFTVLRNYTKVKLKPTVSLQLKVDT